MMINWSLIPWAIHSDLQWQDTMQRSLRTDKQLPARLILSPALPNNPESSHFPSRKSLHSFDQFEFIPHYYIIELEKRYDADFFFLPHIQHPEREFLLRVSYLEVYNEQIHDLLVPTTQSTPPPVKIRQQTNGMFFADPVREEVVTNVGQVATLISRGERQRHVAGTDWNARSSRSHTIFGIVIESRLYGVEGGVRRSKVCLIDLAGNERASSEVERRSEGSFINKRYGLCL
jgi:hypothetical protein